MRTDYSNIYFKDGVPCDLSKLSHKELQEFSTHIRCEDQYKFERLECVRSMYNASVPNVKLFYPEPYIASPSYIHEDLGFLHILQYQY